MSITYKAASLEDIARMFDANAKSERKYVDRIKGKRLKEIALARAITWELSAHVLRQTVIEPIAPTVPTVMVPGVSDEELAKGVRKMTKDGARIPAIKWVRERRRDWGLKEALDYVNRFVK
jgi:hypothetical protein